MKWPIVEQKVGQAEKISRRLKKTRGEAQKEIDGVGGANKKGRSIKEGMRLRVAEIALEKEKALEKELEEMLGEDNSQQRQFVSFKMSNLRKALKLAHTLKSEIERLKAEETYILGGINEEPNSSELQALQDIREEIGVAESKLDRVIQSSPEAYYGLHLLELKKYKEDLASGRIVETPYVVKQIDDVVSHVRAGRPVMIYGHLGSGKTELALHVARNYILQNRPDIDQKIELDYVTWLSQNEHASETEKQKERSEIEASRRSALVISGSKNMSTSELYGHQVLDIQKIKKGEAREKRDN